MLFLGAPSDCRRSQALRESLLSSSVLPLRVVSPFPVVFEEVLDRENSDRKLVIIDAGLLAC